jgi:hypothetical protein
MQWVYSRVSRASLQKTGVFLDSAGDFWEFSPQKVRTSVSRNYWRPEKPAFGGPFSSKEGNSLKRGLPGWRRSADRTRLQANSLLTGNFTGKIAILWLPGWVSEQGSSVPQRFFAKFPTQGNREIILDNREFSALTGNKCISLSCPDQTERRGYPAPRST